MSDMLVKEKGLCPAFTVMACRCKEADIRLAFS